MENVTLTNFPHQISYGTHSVMVRYKAQFHRPEQTKKLVGNQLCVKELWYLYISSRLNQIFEFTPPEIKRFNLKNTL